MTTALGTSEGAAVGSRAPRRIAHWTAAPTPGSGERRGRTTSIRAGQDRAGRERERGGGEGLES